VIQVSTQNKNDCTISDALKHDVTQPQLFKTCDQNMNSVTMTIKVGTNCAKTLSRTKSSAYVGHVTILI